MATESDARGPERGSDNHRPPLRDVVDSSMQDFSTLIGRPLVGVSGVQRRDDGWTILFEVTELERIPVSTSVLALYEVQTDDRGGITGYRRLRRYHRSQAGEG